MRTMKKGKEIIRVKDEEVDKYLDQRYYFCSRKEYKSKQKKNKVFFKIRFSGEMPKYLRHKKSEAVAKIKEVPTTAKKLIKLSAKKGKETSDKVVNVLKSSKTKVKDKIAETGKKIKKTKDVIVAINNIIKMNKTLKKNLKKVEEKK